MHSSSGRGSTSSHSSSFGGGYYHGGPSHYSSGYRGFHHYGGPGRPLSVTNLSGMLRTFIILAFIICFVMAFRSGSNITRSTVERTKLDGQYTTSTEFYVDELDWIRNSSELNNSMQSFYNETGVHPLLYITDTVNGTMSPASSDMETYSEKLYDELCPDEGHILLLFHCLDGGTDYSMWYTCGAQAKTVMDEEACNILMDYIDSYFYTDKSEDRMFGDAFKDAGKRIMTKTTSPVVYIVVCGTIIFIIAADYIWWKKIKAQKNREAEQTERILNSDLSTFSETSSSDPEIRDLESKYN